MAVEYASVTIGGVKGCFRSNSAIKPVPEAASLCDMLQWRGICGKS